MNNPNPDSTQPIDPHLGQSMSSNPGPTQQTTGPNPSAPGPRSRRGSAYLAMALAILLALLIGGLGGWLLGNRASSADVPTSSEAAAAENVASKLRTAVVQVNVQISSSQASIGSGVLIDPRGYIVTNNHVVEGGQNMTVALYNGTTLPAQLIGADSADDLAVIHINPPSNITVATLGDSSNLKVAEPVLAIGNPLGITQTVTRGIVSALGRTVPEGTGDAVIFNAVQTDAAINPGNSGGALVDLQGKLIGIPTLVPLDPEFGTPANGVGFAIPSSTVKFIVPQLINSGRVAHSGRAGLGVSLIDIDPTIAAQNQLPVDHGAMIVKITPGSAADQAGLKLSDIIVQIDNTPVNNFQDLQSALLTKDVGQTVSLKIYRGNQQMTVSVKLEELPTR